jgi:uncharacterized protein (TIGR03067 family)
MELFLNGENYQFRERLRDSKEAEPANWSFPDVPLTPENLVGAYEHVGIFSRSADSEPPARWWHHSVGRSAYVMHKHLTDVNLVYLPPYMSVLHPRWDRRHLIDLFYRAAEENYRVVKQEEVDGRLLTVVDSLVDSANEPRHLLRGWLDLARGAVPVKIFATQVLPTATIDTFDQWERETFERAHASTLATEEIRELPNGGFYPVRTRREDRAVPLDAAKTKPDGVEGDKRPRPTAIVEHRYTWDCPLVEIKTDWAPKFFVLRFPEGQKIFDHDARKSGGAPVQIPVAHADDAEIKPAEKEGGKSDKDALQGNWQLQSIAIQGKVFKREDKLVLWQEAFDTDFVVQGDRLGQAESKTEFVLDDSRSPKQITIVNEKEMLSFLGIYELDGDTLKACFDGRGTEGRRPETFAAKGPTIVTITLKKKVDGK